MGSKTKSEEGKGRGSLGYVCMVGVRSMCFVFLLKYMLANKYISYISWTNIISGMMKLHVIQTYCNVQSQIIQVNCTETNISYDNYSKHKLDFEFYV